MDREPVVEFEKGVIEVERDASTMTVTFGTNAEEVHVAGTRKNLSNMFGFTQYREHGWSKMDSYFASEISNAQLPPLALTNVFTTTDSELQVTNCNFIRSGHDGRSVVGLWSGDAFHSIMYKLEFDLTGMCSKKADESPVLVKNFKKKGPYYLETHVVDMCNALVRQHDSLLYVGFSGDILKGRPRICSFELTSPCPLGNVQLLNREILCCTAPNISDICAVGTVEGVFCYRDGEFVNSVDYQGSITSVEFNSTGQVLYCGTNFRLLHVIDWREGARIGTTTSITDLCETGLSDIKLLSDETAMIVCGNDNSLSKVDLRNSKVILRYPKHTGSGRKFPFTISERSNLVCATGLDSVTRLWSLDTGILLRTIRPHYQKARTQSCLFTNGDRWAVGIFQKDKMYTIEPCV